MPAKNTPKSDKIPPQSRFTPENCKKILDAIGIGSPFMLAALSAGVNYGTFRKWIRWGEEKGTGPYFEFAQEVKKAEGNAVSVWLAVIEKAARTGNWTAAAWKLERRYPEMFSRAMIKVEPEAAAEVQGLDDKALEERIRALIQRVGLPGLAQGKEPAPTPAPKPDEKKANTA